MNILTNLTERLRAGRAKERQKKRESEQDKIGTLRAGNSGIMSEQGEIAGACHRLAHLRSLGIEVEEPDDSKMIMFQMGTASEDVIYKDLLHTKVPGEIILREEEIPVLWQTKNGTKVTGRPDIVVGRQDSQGTRTFVRGDDTLKFTPLFVVEAKSVASVWTSKELLGLQQPKLANLVQAGHYSWQLDVPGRLLYKQYSIQEIPSFVSNSFRLRKGYTPLWPLPEHSDGHMINHEKGRVKPFEIVYELEWTKGGFLSYRREDSNEGPVVTMVQKAGIERFYEFVSTMEERKDLGPRPLTLDALGKEKEVSNCQYCPLQEVCDKYESKGYTRWLKEVKKVK